MESGAIVALLLKYRYWIIFPVAVVEGPVLSFLIGTLAGLGYFNPFLAYPILVLGDLIPDTALFYLGRRGERGKLIAKYGPKIGVTPERFGVIQRIWLEHPRKTMVLAKLALGLSTPLLVLAGLVGIKPRVFYSVAIPLALMQHIVLLTLGYHFAASYALVKGSIGNAEFFIGAAALFAILYYIFASYMKGVFFRVEAKEEQETKLP